MYVEFFQAYPGGHDKDPGYADFRINCNGRRYSGTCDVDGARPRDMKTISQEGYIAHQETLKGRWTKLRANNSGDITARIASILHNYVGSRGERPSERAMRLADVPKKRAALKVVAMTPKKPIRPEHMAEAEKAIEHQAHRRQALDAEATIRESRFHTHRHFEAMDKGDTSLDARCANCGHGFNAHYNSSCPKD